MWAAEETIAKHRHAVPDGNPNGISMKELNKEDMGGEKAVPLAPKNDDTAHGGNAAVKGLNGANGVDGTH